MSCDYSQIEFRLIAHYIKDARTIEAYSQNAATDFHTWVAQLCGVSRKAGKTLNFAMAYGAGKNRITSQLSQDPDIVEEVGEQINAAIAAGTLAEQDRGEEFKRLCRAKAGDLYNKYHEMLPGLSETTKKAEKIARWRGYVFNLAGRRRHLPNFMAHKAFNSLVQGFAMDVIKERMVAMSPRYNPQIRDLGISIVANVHDEVLFEVPQEMMLDPQIHDLLLQGLQATRFDLRVPIMAGLGVSTCDWSEAADDVSVTKLAGPVEHKHYDPTAHGPILSGRLR